MEPDRLPRAPRAWPDVITWTIVVLSAIATAASAVAALSGRGPMPLQTVTGSAALLLLSATFAIVRHSRAARAARVCRSAYVAASASEVGARERLSFARHTAAVMAGLPLAEGVHAVLEESLERFSAEAAAIVGDDITLVTAPGVDVQEAHAAVLHVAMETVRAGHAVAQELVDDGAHALTIPLRIRGALSNVLVLWRRSGSFSADDLDGLSLVARIVELSMENLSLVDDVKAQLDGTLNMMIDLVEQRLPNYSAHSQRVSRFAVAVGRSMGMPDDELEDLRVAGMLHDVGMLAVPESILNTPRRLTLEEQVELRGHPEHGADLTRVANFSPRVQATIRSHHERVDGMGYPEGLAGDQIPVASRILNVCDAFVALVSDRPHRAKVSVPEALAALRASAGTHYDPAVVETFVGVHEALLSDESRAAYEDHAAAQGVLVV